MADEPLSHTLELLRRMHGKLDRLLEDTTLLKVPVTGLEEDYATVNRRLDRLERDIDHIKRRLDLVEA